MQNRNNILTQIVDVAKPIIGMVHALATPGAPRAIDCDVNRIYDHALEEAHRLKAGGVDAILIENAGDVPFLRPEMVGFETVSVMSVAGRKIVEEIGLPVGFNIVANAAKASLACAKASGASFVRVNQWANAYVANEGIIEGAAPEAMRYRKMIDATDIAIFADVHVKHGSHAIVADRPVEEQARDVAFFQADVAIVTGLRTGHPVSLVEVEEVRAGILLPCIVGSGLSATNAADILKVADGAIVGVSFKESGDMWGENNIDKVKQLMDVVYKFR
jgi:membrane complex biogenesis BtpA family protein